MNENAPRLKVVYRPTATLTPYARNSNLHSPEQVQQIAASIQRFGFTNPALIDENGELIAGHGRLLAAQMLGMDEVPCIVLAHLTPDERRAYVIADNQLAKKSDWDMEVLVAELQALAETDFDLGLIGFDYNEIDALLRGEGLLPDTPAGGGGDGYTGTSQRLPEKYVKTNDRALLRKFGVPPFSVFDCRQGYWMDRKRTWLGLIGDTSATKEGTLGSGTLIEFINNGSSGFDPVLAEIAYTWFCPPGGRVLDPFGGEQTKGYVAGHLGLQYDAVEMREEQIEFNRRACAGMEGVRYVQGDSNNLSRLIKGAGFDLVFTSPPYYDLEVYSAEDMSALGTYEEFMRQYEAIFAQCVQKMADNRFLVVKVGEIRNKKTGAYRNFVGHNVDLFQRLGLHFYNEIILLTPIGTAAIRADRTFKTRKVVRTHANVLVFYKGDPTKISDHFPAIQFDHDLGAEGADNEPEQ